MSELSSSNWSENAASNNAASPNGFPEGMTVSAFNDSCREIMSAIKRFWNRVQGANATTGSDPAYILTPTAALTAYATGERYSGRASFTNGGVATLAISGLAATGIKKYTSAGKVDLAAGDIQNGQPFTVEYDGTHFVLVTPTANVAVSGSETTAGVVELATQTEVNLGVDTTRVITPAKLARVGGSGPWTDVASGATTDLGAQVSANLRITGTTTITGFGTVESGISRVLRFAGALTLTHNATSLILPGGANITTQAGDTAYAVSLGTGNWIVIVFERALTSYDSGNQTITAAGALSLTHGLATAPRTVAFYLKNLTTEANYAVGDEVLISPSNDYSTTSRGIAAVVSSTAINVRFGSVAGTFQLLDKTTGGITTLTNANWALVVRAYI